MSYWSEMRTSYPLAKSSGSDSRSFMVGAAVAAMLAFVRLVISRMQIRFWEWMLFRSFKGLKGLKSEILQTSFIKS